MTCSRVSPIRSAIWTSASPAPSRCASICSQSSSRIGIADANLDVMAQIPDRLAIGLDHLLGQAHLDPVQAARHLLAVFVRKFETAHRVRLRRLGRDRADPHAFETLGEQTA